jgi:hypothetical protein
VKRKQKPDSTRNTKQRPLSPSDFLPGIDLSAVEVSKAVGKANIREIARLFGVKTVLKWTGCRHQSRASVKAWLFQIVYFAQKGDKLAALKLYEIALAGTIWLNRLALERPDLFSPIAASTMAWPVLWGAHPEESEANKAFVRWLKLGSGFGINFSEAGKIFSLDVPANNVAIDLFCLAQALRRAPTDDWDGYNDWTVLLRSDAVHDPQRSRELEAWGHRVGKILPTLSRATVREWKSPMRGLFRIVYGEKFDRHPDLQELKKSVIGHAKDGSGRQGPGVVRQAMLRKVLQALHSIAPLD